MTVRRTPFAAVPDWVLSHEVIKSNRTVLHVYAAMYLDADFGDREGKADWEAISERTGLSKPTIYRDVKALRDAGIIEQLGVENYWMPMDPNSTVVDENSMVVENSSTAVEPSFLTEVQSTSEPRDPMIGFDHFWTTYPRRHGRILGRGLCEKRWRKLSLEDKRAAYRGAKNYATDVVAGLTIAKDPDRWLRDRLWTDWLEDAVHAPVQERTYNDPEIPWHPPEDDEE